MTPLSILHVSLSRDIGGAERYALDLASRQLGRGHRLGLVMRGGSRAARAFRRDAPTGLILAEAGWLFASRAVARAVRAQAADILHVHLPDDMRAALAARPHPPVVQTLHIRYRQKEARGLSGLVRIADWQQAESRGFAGPAVTAHNWPPAERPADPAMVAAARQAIGAGPGSFVVGSIARLHRIKRIDLLIAAWKQARPAGGILALIGDGPERADLMARADGDPTIRFLGHHGDVENWHRALDLFVLPSDWEGLPLGVLEAMRAGTPILATASAGTAEVLAPTPARLVSCGDAAALSAALAEAASRFRAGALGRLTYDLSRFDAEQALDRIETLYRRVLATPPA